MRRSTLALLCAAALTSGGCTIGMRPGTGIDRSAGDPSVRAQDDFFRRVTGRTGPFEPTMIQR